jgi:hypothetical protein
MGGTKKHMDIRQAVFQAGPLSARQFSRPNFPVGKSSPKNRLRRLKLRATQTKVMQEFF